MPDFLGPYPTSFPYNANGDRIAVIVEMKAPGYVSNGCITFDIWGGARPSPSGPLGGMDSGCFILDPSLMVDPNSPTSGGGCTQPPCGCGGVGCGELYGLLPVGGCPGGAIGATGCLGVGKFIVIDLNGNGQIAACLKVVEIVYTEDDWDGTTGDGKATCPVEFGYEASFPSIPPFPSGYYIDNTLTNQCTCGNAPPACSCGSSGTGSWYADCPCEVPYLDLQPFSFGSVQPLISIHNDCNSCINAIPWCTDPLSYNYIGTSSAPGPCSTNYATCDANLASCTTNCCCPNVTNNSVCIYPGCPDTSACNYVSGQDEGCLVSGIFVQGDTSCCEYCACWDSNVCTSLNSGPSTPWPAGTMGCVANYTQDCTGNIVSPQSTNLVAPNPNCGYNGGDGCFRIGCNDPDAANYDPNADGCYFPGTPTAPLTNASGGQYDCCQYKGCDDPLADNYNDACPPASYNVLTMKGKNVDMPCPGGDNCVYTNEECMDRGCCTDGISCGAVGTLVSAQCPSGLELCPNNVGISLCSNYPIGCTPGVDCVSAIDYDPSANQQCTPISSCCTYEGGYVCELDPVTSTYSCIDVYASSEVQPYNWLDPDIFGPCTDTASCAAALADCNTYCDGVSLEECAVFLNDYNGNVYSYDPDVDPNNMNFLFKDEQFDETYNRNTFFGGVVADAYGTASWDIANTADYLWLYACKVVDQDQMSGTYGQLKYSTTYPNGCTPGVDCAPLGIIREYAIDLSTTPMTVGGMTVPVTNPPFIRDIEITSLCQEGYNAMTVPNVLMTLGNGLVAKNDTTLISSGEKVLEIDITTSPVSIGVGTTQELFMLPNVSYPSIDHNNPTPTTDKQGRSTGDILIDPLTNNLIITYYDMLGPLNGKMGQFENNSAGAIMDHSTSSPSNWSETQVTQNPTLPGLYGLFKWNGNWYGADQQACGTHIHQITDISTLLIDTTIYGTLNTLSCGGYNPIQGASQQDGCTDIEDVYCCTDPLALNFVSIDCIDDGSCIYPTEGRKDCLPRLTKEEFLMNVCQKPETRSDVFIERGKVSVFERPQRLSQITTIGELDIHGYGYYNILIQD